MRRESTNEEDLFIGHINGMDNYARGLRAAAEMVGDGTIDAMVMTCRSAPRDRLGSYFV